MHPPETCYVHADVEAIAYQEWGEGDIVILSLDSWGVSVEAWREHRAHIRLWEMYGSIGRGLLLDYRGFGVSVPVP